MSQRPLDILDSSKGDRILVKLKSNGRNGGPATISGTLKAFDLHLNMWIKDATFETDDSQTQYGKILVRGDNVMLVSPE